MKKQTKSLVLSALSALALGAVGTTGTFALFTDKAETTIQAQAGIVDINDTLTILSVSELYNESVSAVNGVYTNSVGSKTYIDEDNANLLHLEKWVPGDKAVINMLVENASNVDIRTRMVVSHTSTSNPDLFNALKITYDVKDASNNDITNMLGEWRTIPASTHVIQNVKITIEFPNHGEEITVREQGLDNGYQDANCAILFSQQAVQGNAHTPNSAQLLNEILDASDTVNPTMYDALAEANITAAYALEKGYVWDSQEDEFLFESEVVAGHRYFKVYEGAMPSNPAFSVYAYDWATAGTITIDGIGFDSGDVTGFTQINYVNSTNTAKTVIVRSNDGVLTVNAPTDTVHHYNYANLLTIYAVAGNSYHEHGSVGEAQLKEGRLVVEKGGYIEELSGFGEGEKAVEIKGCVIEVKDTIEEAIVEEESTGTYAEQEDEDGSEIKVYNFEQFQALAARCNEGFTFKGVTLKLMNDLDFTNKVWTPFGRYVYRGNWKKGEEENIVLRDSRFFMGNIDGNGHKIINLSNVGFAAEDLGIDEGTYSPTVNPDYGLIRLATGDITIKDLEISYAYQELTNQKIKDHGIIALYFTQELDPVAKVTWDSVNEEWNAVDSTRFNRQTGAYQMKETQVLFQNVKTTGTIIGKDSMSAYIGSTYGNGTHPQTLDDKGIYEWRSVKWAFENAVDRSGDSRSATAEVKSMTSDANGLAAAKAWIENYVKTDGSGWYAEPFLQDDANNQEEIYFMHGEDRLVYDSGNCVGYAPLFVNYKFVGCNNSANVTAFGKRAGVFFAKFSNGTDLDNMAVIAFDNCVNSGNAQDSSTPNPEKNYAPVAAIIAGYCDVDQFSVVYLNGGLANTGKAIEYDTVYEGDAALLKTYRNQVI